MLDLNTTQLSSLSPANPAVADRVSNFWQVMKWCEMPKADMDCLVSKESAAQIHVVFMGQGLQPEALEQRRLKGDYAKIVAFRPTGELNLTVVYMKAESWLLACVVR